MTEENLVDQLQAESTDQPTGSTESQEPSWHWSDEVAGEGDKPDWLIDSKYKSVSDQAKGYNEIRKQLGQFTGAPEEYELGLPEDLVLPEGVEWELKDDDPLLAAVVPIAKEMNMSQDGLNKLIKTFVEYEAGAVASEMASEGERVESELSSIPDGVKRVGAVSGWARANMSSEDYEAFKGMMTDANTLQMAENLIKMTRGSKLPDPSDSSYKGAVTQADIDAAFTEKDAQGNNKYASDPSHRQKVQRMMQNYHGTA